MNIYYVRKKSNQSKNKRILIYIEIALKFYSITSIILVRIVQIYVANILKCSYSTSSSSNDSNTPISRIGGLLEYRNPISSAIISVISNT